MSLAQSPALPPRSAKMDLSNQMDDRFAAGGGAAWRLAQASGFRGRSTSGEAPSLTHDFRQSRNSMEWSRPLRCHATVISWRFCRTGTDGWTSGLRRSVLGNFTTDAEVRRNSSNPSCAPWGSRPIALSSRFGFASRRLEAEATSASGRCQRWADSRGHTLKAWPSSTGSRRLPTRVPHARTRRPAVSCQTAAAIGGSAHLHCTCRAPLSLSAVGARHGVHLLRPGFLPDKLDIWRISPAGGSLNGSRHTWARESSGPIGSADAECTSLAIPMVSGLGFIAWMSSAAFPPADLWP